ncbi:hypothetical protein VK72_14245 [Paenibacillus polymyxa]|nr:hypothetical protein AOU00_01055 [Paenibacillus polymyxa]APQ59786.1 hypothetical protein VK72_14245 [Paenibacillus polymyxa]
MSIRANYITERHSSKYDKGRASMQIHRLKIKWDIKKENAEIYTLSMLQVFGITLPVVVIVEAPSWIHEFTFVK